MTKTHFKHPHTPIIQAIYQLNCGRVARIASYVFYRSEEQIKFGSRVMTVAEFCKEWDEYNAGAFMVQAYAGPPGKQNWIKISLASLAVDWYFKAITSKNKFGVRKLEEMLLLE